MHLFARFDIVTNCMFVHSNMGLRLEFPVQLENKHVIEPEQIFVRVIGEF